MLLKTITYANICTQIYVHTNLCTVMHLKEGSIVEDDLGSRNPELHDSVIGCSGGLGGAQALLQVTVEGPQLETTVQAALNRTLSLSRTHSLQVTHD